jgi:hypothetical protein
MERIALLLVALVALAATTSATPVCTYRSCPCLNKDCDPLGACTTFVQESGSCGNLNRICNCATGQIYEYASPGCTGSLTATYSDGGCYGKSKCIFMDSCIEPTPSVTPSPSALPTQGPVGTFVALRWPPINMRLSAYPNATAKVDNGTTNAWHVLRYPNNLIAIKSYYGHYITAQPDGSFTLTSMPGQPSVEQMYVFDILPVRMWSFRSTYGGYLGSAANGTLVAYPDASIRWQS